MNKLIIFFLMTFLISCISNKDDLKEISIEFHTASVKPTKFAIDLNNRTMEQYQYQSSIAYVDSSAPPTKYHGFSGYPIRYRDTLIVYYKKTFQINKSDLNKFLQVLHKNKLDSNITHHLDGLLDGVSFKLNTISIKNDTFSLKSNCTDRDENKLEYKYLDPFFELANATIKDYKGICIVEDLQNHFSPGLRIKLMSDEPLEYRIWGTISNCRNDNPELLEFLKRLPNDKPIIFDLRNGSFSPCLYELFDEYGNKKKIFYYSMEDNQWAKIKLKNSFKTKEQVMKAIANMQCSPKGSLLLE